MAYAQPEPTISIVAGRGMEPFHKAKRALITRTKAFAIGPVIGNSQGHIRQNDLQSKARAVCAASLLKK